MHAGAARPLASRPRYGSSPYHEHLQRVLSAMRRAAASASASESAPVTWTRTSLVAPSASPAICSARCERTRRDGVVEGVPGRRGATAPLASSRTVSFVDWQPSTLSVERVGHAGGEGVVQLPGSRSASVVSTASIVAIFGESIAAPFAMPPTTKPSPRRPFPCDGVRWSAMASAASVAPSTPLGGDRPGMPRHRLHGGQAVADEAGGHISVVQAAAQPSAATRAAEVLGVGVAGLAGGGVGVAVQQNRRGVPWRAAAQVVLAELDRRVRHLVRREDARGGDGLAVPGGDQGEVEALRSSLTPAWTPAATTTRWRR